MKYYLAYDIRSIQKYIFAVPNLRCVIGASELIAQVDERVANKFGDNAKYCGGGGGLLEADDETQLEDMIAFIRAEAQEIGVDLRIGSGESPSIAKANSQLYAYWLDSLEGEPCSMSGLYPVVAGAPGVAWKNSAEGKTVHRLIGMRRDESRRDRLGSKLLERISDRLPEEFREFDLRFFRNVSPESARDFADLESDDDAEARCGASALGSRNRWAVIAMDGNDAGNQHLFAQKLVTEGKWTEDQRRIWINAMSKGLNEATNVAFEQALVEAIQLWWSEHCNERIPKSCVFEDARTGRKRLILPIRPLVIGGDDVILLCHTDLAVEFVMAMTRQFSQRSVETAKAFEQQHSLSLWPASGNRLTISAGVLFCKVTYPLHNAIQYAESLLASAKGKYRRDQKDASGNGEPTPAAIDFDCVTDTLLDTPSDRRNRELVFFDEDLGRQVCLTCRPYRINSGDHEVIEDDNFEQLLHLRDSLASQDTPRSLLAEIADRLARPWSERMEYLQTISRKHPDLYSALSEPSPDGSSKLPHDTTWKIGDDDARTTRRNSFLDALILLDEQRRQDYSTVR